MTQILTRIGFEISTEPGRQEIPNRSSLEGLQGHNSRCLVDSRWSTSKVVNISVAGSQIPKIGNVCACSTGTTGQIAKQMARGDSAYRIGLGRNLQCPGDGAGNGSLVGNTLVAVFQIPKIGDVCACSTAATGPIAKWMAPGDSAHQISTGHNSRCLVDSKWSTSVVVNISIAGT